MQLQLFSDGSDLSLNSWTPLPPPLLPPRTRRGPASSAPARPLPRRHNTPPPRRRTRLPAPRPPAAPLPAGIDDLQRSISALVQQLGFDDARRTLEQLHEEQRGQGLFEGLQDERDKLARLLE